MRQGLQVVGPLASFKIRIDQWQQLSDWMTDDLQGKGKREKGKGKRQKGKAPACLL